MFIPENPLTRQRPVFAHSEDLERRKGTRGTSPLGSDLYVGCIPSRCVVYSDSSYAQLFLPKFTRSRWARGTQWCLTPSCDWVCSFYVIYLEACSLIVADTNTRMVRFMRRLRVSSMTLLFLSFTSTNLLADKQTKAQPSLKRLQCTQMVNWLATGRFSYSYKIRFLILCSLISEYEVPHVENHRWALNAAASIWIVLIKT